MTFFFARWNLFNRFKTVISSLFFFFDLNPLVMVFVCVNVSNSTFHGEFSFINWVGKKSQQNILNKIFKLSDIKFSGNKFPIPLILTWLTELLIKITCQVYKKSENSDMFTNKILIKGSLRKWINVIRNFKDYKEKNTKLYI